jgi:hypothetical protein
MALELEDRRKWRFEHTSNDAWRWVFADDGIETVSARSFSTLKECIEDAKVHGYLPHVPERRSSS